MPQIRHSIEVNVPLRTAYNQWTQFEDFPRFMEGVLEVHQKDDVHLHWHAERHGSHMEWDSEITDQVPDQVIAWRDMDGPCNHGSIHFYPVREDQTRIELIMDIDTVAGTQPTHEDETDHRIGEDLHRFKAFVEKQGQESGAWRGEIHHAQVERSGFAQGIPSSQSSIKNTQV